jgi:hypothetical protein
MFMKRLEKQVEIRHLDNTSSTEDEDSVTVQAPGCYFTTSVEFLQPVFDRPTVETIG